MISFVCANEIRTQFSQAMSDMYKKEVPAYGDLIRLVERVNEQELATNACLREEMLLHNNLKRVSSERHGAIRIGTAYELSNIAKVFAVMHMHPVGYYDLSVAGIPVHSTAFRPLSPQDLRINPFRIFTSLLRLELIADQDLRRHAENILQNRQIFPEGLLELVELKNAQGGLTYDQTDEFVSLTVEIFRWHEQAQVDQEVYDTLHKAHRLIADVVSFKGPHINHLTPRTLNIDAVQEKMLGCGITPKAFIEGPPKRNVPILLRQTSFKALEEKIIFPHQGDEKIGTHTARFGEIEMRGAALTPKGRVLYDGLLEELRARITPAVDGSNVEEYHSEEDVIFKSFPDDIELMRKQKVAYFEYQRVEGFKGAIKNIEDGIARKVVQYTPLVYEDFLPVSAAGIFQSNLGDDAGSQMSKKPNRSQFEQALGMSVIDEFKLYERIESASLQKVLIN